MLRIGAAMLILGGVTKLGVKTYRQIRNKEFFTNVAPQTFYKGGFYATMNRREAQLILGVREGVAAEEIKQRHRKLMIMNHPDSGGSTYVAMKVNEAKDLLLKT